MRARVVGVVVLPGEGVVQVGNQHARVLGELLLHAHAGVLRAEDRRQGSQMVAQLLQGELVGWLAGGARVPVQIVEAEAFEVARAQHRGLHAERKRVRVAQRLLHRRDHGTLPLLGLVQVDLAALLLDQEPGLRAQHVDEAAAHGLVLEHRAP